MLIWRLVIRPMNDGAPRVLVAAHDAPAVAAALTPVYGAALEVVRSPFGPDAYEAAERFALLAERRGVLVATGEGIGPADGVVRRRVALLRVDSALADAAVPVPDGLLRMDVLISP